MMKVIQVLRKTFENGYMSTWKFGQTSNGEFLAISNKGAMKSFQTFDALTHCANIFTIKYGYGERVMPEIHRACTQLALAI